MSEYQYYEFLAIDRPLDKRQRAELRALSSRAEITATSFINEYHWGDFRGNPRALMEGYFDAFLYLANWGTRHLMFRLPRTLLNIKNAEQYCYTDVASAWEAGEHVIIGLFADGENDDDWDEPHGQLASMVSARAELASGDLRVLYLAWLLAVQTEEVDEEEAEPPVPAGLGSLSAPLKAIADFVRIDEDLLQVAASASPPLPRDDRPTGALADWVRTLPGDEKDALLARVADGEGAAVQALLQRRFRDSGKATAPAAVAGTRTAGQLLDEAASHREARQRAEAERARRKEARKAAAAAAAYQQRLDDLAKDVEPTWARATALIDTKSQRDYDEAVGLLKDLRALADRQGESAAFTQRFLALRSLHQRKPSLMARFDAAGLPR